MRTVAILGALLFAAALSFAGPGSLDPSFGAIVDGSVYSTTVQPDGRIVIAGSFTHVNGIVRNRLARLFPDGSLDTAFMTNNVGAPATVWAAALQIDGRIVICGDFTTFGGQQRARIARLNRDGTLDGTFNPAVGPNNSVQAMSLTSDGKIVIAGTFTQVSGAARRSVARLLSDGTLDPDFNPGQGVVGPVYSVAAQTDGKVLIGGGFTQVFGSTRNRIARLLSNGVIDQAYQEGLTGASGNVRTIVLQGDGKALIGGEFASVNSTPRSRIARLKADGTLDTTFAPGTGANGSVYAIGIEPDSDILLGGDFTTFATAPRSRFARVFADGGMDLTFLPNDAGANLLVRTLTPQADGSILAGGDFTIVSGKNVRYFAKLYGDFYPPEIIRQPTNRSVTIGTDISFSVAVSNPTPVSYQWRKNGKDITGATLNSYALFNVQTSDSAAYSVAISNGAGSSVSSNAVLYVGEPPTITAQPQSLVLSSGQDARFEVQATGTDLVYQWRLNGGILRDATNSFFTITNVSLTNSGSYSVTVSNAFRSVLSTPATLRVVSAPKIIDQPQDLSVDAGANFTLSVNAVGDPAPGFQWRHNEQPLIGATQPEFTANQVSMGNAGPYDVVITNSEGNITSRVATVTVIYHVPEITIQPTNINVDAGSEIRLAADATGTSPLVWQWFKGEIALADQRAPILSIPNASTNDVADYFAIAANGVGMATSLVAHVTVVYHAPEMTAHPGSTNVAVGGTIFLNADASGSPVLQWQWFKGNALLPGQTNRLQISASSTNDSGSYFAWVTNTAGAATSFVARVVVGLPPSITVQPASVTNALASQGQLQAIVDGTPPIQLQWSLNDRPITDATNAILTLTNVVPAQMGWYRLDATNDFGGTTSSNASLSITGFSFDEWNGLVAFYPFTGNANDASGRNHGIVHEATLTSDRFGAGDTAYHFDGNEFIECPDAPDLNPGLGDFTLMAWLRADHSQGDRYIVAKYSADIPGGHGLGLEAFGKSYQMIWPDQNPTPVAAHGPVNIDDGAWHHLAAVTSRHGTLDLYRDGQLDSSIPIGSLAGSISNSFPMLIGRTVSGQPFIGSIDEIRLYNRALNKKEIFAQYARDIKLEFSGPAPVEAPLGGTVTFAVGADVEGQVSYQWLKDGGTLSGQTNSSLVISNIVLTDSAMYSVQVSNSLGTAVSEPASLTITGYPFPQWGSLIAYYPADGNFRDASGNGLDCITTNLNPTINRFGAADSAVLFDGVSSGAIQSNPVLNIGQNQYSISIWMRSDDVGKLNQGLFNTMPHNGTYVVFNHELAPNAISARLGNGGGWISPHYSGSTLDFHNGDWHHILYVKDGAQYSTYIDGRLDIQYQFLDALSLNVPSAFRIGSIGADLANSGEFFKGALDDVRVFRRALSHAEAIVLYTFEIPQTITVSAEFVAGDLLLRFESLPNVTYSVLASADLNGPWLKIKELNGAAAKQISETRLPVEQTATQQFFRVIR